MRTAILWIDWPSAFLRSLATLHHTTDGARKVHIIFCKSRAMLLLPALFNLFDDEFSPAFVVFSARVFGALYLTSLLPLTSLH